MIRLPFDFCLTRIFFPLLAASAPLSEEQALGLAEKIWHNECKGSIKGLTSWNEGEDFASMGIGHFIWYPDGRAAEYEETFPLLLIFLEKQGKTLPSWLQKNRKCPWYTKKDFEGNFTELPMRQLRTLLYETRKEQALFMAERLQKALPLMIAAEPKRAAHIESLFNQLSQTPKGLFMLMDYVNFKGYGTSELERYKGEGWGLLQVLIAMPGDSKDLYRDFVKAARKVLARRVDNSNPARNEERWLQGWNRRVERYLD